MDAPSLCCRQDWFLAPASSTPCCPYSSVLLRAARTASPCVPKSWGPRLPLSPPSNLSVNAAVSGALTAF